VYAYQGFRQQQKRIAKHHKENSIYFEGWKSNESWCVNRKVGLPYYSERWEMGSFPIRRGNEPSRTDIDQVPCGVMSPNQHDLRKIPGRTYEEVQARWDHGLILSESHSYQMIKEYMEYFWLNRIRGRPKNSEGNLAEKKQTNGKDYRISSAQRVAL